MKIKKPMLCMIAIAIMGLLITSTLGLGISEVKETEENLVGIPSNDIFVAKAESLPLQKMSTISYSANSISSRGTDTLIFSSDLTNQNPAIVTDGAGNVLVFTEETDGSTTNLWGRWSNDGGLNWIDESEITGWNSFDALLTRPELDYYGKGKTAWGTVLPGPFESGTVRYIGLPDITDPFATDPNNPDGWSAWYVDWGGSAIVASNIDSMDVACYSNLSNVPSAEFWGLVALTGDQAYPGYEEDNTFMFSFWTPEGVTIIFFYNLIEDVFNMKTDIDQFNGKVFLVTQYENHDTYADGSRVVYKAVSTNPNWWQGGWSGYYFEGVFNPDIVAFNNKCFIVGEKDNGGQKDIVCLRSTGASFSEFVVSADPADELYPTVTLVPSHVGFDVICSYIRNGDLYTAISSDYGQTWDEVEAPVNDETGTVVDQYNTASIDGQYAAWTDEKNTPTEIYFDIIYEFVNVPPNTPTIDGPLKVGKDVQADYTFSTTDPDGDSVSYFVDWGDGTNTGWITATTASHTWTKKAKYQITCKARDNFYAESGIATLEIQVPRSRTADILYLFFERYPNAFPLLRAIFGY